MLSPVLPSAVDYTPSGTFFQTPFDPWVTYTQKNPFVYPTQEPVFSISNNSTPKTNTSNSFSEEGSQTIINPIDDRKQRRKISNRESARRSRIRKQKHLENLRNLLNRHKSGNRELIDRLRYMSQQEQIIRQENERLRTESDKLRQRLWDLHQVMLVRQLPNQLLLSSAWPCNNNNVIYSFNEQNPPSLIT